MDKQIRRYQNNLVTIGTGILFMGIWSILKTIFMYLLSPATSIYNVFANGGTVENSDLILTAAVLSLVSLAIDLFLRVYTGFSARAEGYGKKKKYGYIITAAIMILFHIMNSYYIAAAIISLNAGSLFMEAAVSMIIDITSVVMLAELIFSSIMLKKLTGKQILKRS